MMQVLFLCCDMGETNALIPVMHELHGKEIDFKVMAMGAAINKLKSDSTLKNYMIEVEEKVDTANARNKPLEHIATVIDDLQPIVVISGPASKAQEQILQGLSAKKKIVYLDNFNYATTSSAFETVKDVAKAAQKIICVSNIVKDQMYALEKDRLSEKDIKPLGRPSLENWVKQVQQVDKAAILQKIGFGDKEVVTFIGGYGERYNNGVNEAYDKATNALKDAGYQVHIQHHPNVVKEQPLTTIEAVGMADYVVCYDSTVGFEALFSGKKVIYLQPESVEPYDNIAIQKNLTDCVHTDEELLNALKSSSKQSQDVYEVLGVEKNSTEKITAYILKKLQKEKSKN